MGTDVRLFPGVRSDVFFKVVANGGCIGTVRALIGLFSCVGAQVSTKVVTPVGGISAVVAREGLLHIERLQGDAQS